MKMKYLQLVEIKTKRTGDKYTLLVVIKGHYALQIKCSFSICCDMKITKWQMEKTV